MKGVEAHTERVWQSAQEFGIPRLLYCNKLDREGASFRKAILEIGSRLKGWPLVCQIPWWDKDEFVGVIDIIERVGYRWKSEKQKQRYDWVALQPLLQSSDRALLDEVKIARQRLIEGLADFDETVMDEFLAENIDIDSTTIKSAIRRTIRSGDGRLIPVFAGSSFRHIGVEPLMDAITEYLPNPSERPAIEVKNGASKATLQQLLTEPTKKRGDSHNIASVASVFKVFNHPKEGILSFVRVYHGTLSRNVASYNSNRSVSERPMGILEISAAATQEIPELSIGQIGALKGLKSSRTGDTIITTKNGRVVTENLRGVQIRPPDIPPPVAFLQVDPYGTVAAQQLEIAMENASREDPSLRWTRDPKTDQFTVQGMGKLHLDVSLHSIRQRHKIDAEYGPIEVDYKECLNSAVGPHNATFDRSIAGKPGKASCTVTLSPSSIHQGEMTEDDIVERDGNAYRVQLPSGSEGSAMGYDADEAREQLLNGAVAGLARGPRRGSPMQGCQVDVVLNVENGATQSPTGGHFSGAARLAVQAALREAFEKHQIGIMEPIMLAYITCPESAAGAVQHDIAAAAGGQVLQVSDRSIDASGENAIDSSRVYAPPDPYDSITSLRGKRSTARVTEIVAKVPYKEMLDYDDHLRSRTAGRHSMTMSFDSFAKVVGHRERGL